MGILFFVVAAGTLVLFPQDLIELAASIKSCLIFFSNHYFAYRFDYFSPNAWELPLGHTWSLAIEEQFYFFWPLFIFSLSKISSKKIQSRILFSITVISFGYGQYLLMYPETKKAAYYLLSTRAGQLSLGGWFAFHSNGWTQSSKKFFACLSWLGFFYR